jgi:hypothetical protein
LSAVSLELRAWLVPWLVRRRRLFGRSGRRRDLANVWATEGDMTLAEAKFLYELAREATGGCIVEIGTFRGKSTVACALGARAGGGVRVYAVDPFEPFVGACGGRFGPADRPHLLRNLLLAGVADNVWLLHADSALVTAAWRAPVALLWVDGDHAYEAVRRDVELWLPFVTPGGTVALHDSTDPKLGVRRVVEELVAERVLERVRVVESISVLRKIA